MCSPCAALEDITGVWSSLLSVHWIRSFISTALQYDDALESVGAFGRYQKFVFFLGQVFSMGCCMVNLCYVYIAALPNHWCHVPGLEGLGLSDEEIRNLTVPNEVVDGVEKNRYSGTGECTSAWCKRNNLGNVSIYKDHISRSRDSHYQDMTFNGKPYTGKNAYFFY